MKSFANIISTGIVFTLILFSLTLSHAWANSDESLAKEDILAAVEKKYSGKSFEADFTQISNLAALDISEKAFGRALFSHPGKMRWEYNAPDQHEIITNGTSLWIYRPDENQVMIGNAEEFFKSGGGGAFLSDISLVRKNFTINLETQTSDYVKLSLVAKKRIADIATISIQVSKTETLIEKVTTYNHYNDTTIFEFSNIRFKSLAPDLFEFKTPEGVSIINMNE